MYTPAGPSRPGPETSPSRSGGNTLELRAELCFHHLRNGVNIISWQPGGLRQECA